MKKLSYRSRNLLRETSLCALTILAVLVVGLPFFWALTTSLKPKTEILNYPPTILPREITFANYFSLFTETTFVTQMRNSVIVSTASTLLTLSIAMLSAYSISRFKYHGREFIFKGIIFLYMLPTVLFAVPFYLMMTTLKLVDTYLGLIIAYTALFLPFAIWLLRGFIEAIPIDLEESAKVDGAGTLRTFLSIVVPNTLPGIAATAIFTFIAAWNEFLLALILTTSVDVQPAPPGLYSWAVYTFVAWDSLMTATVVIVIPVLVLFLFIQKRLIRGMNIAVGVKM